MEKTRWPEFLSAKLKSRISLENAEKAQSWAIGFLSLASFGFALQGIAGPGEAHNTIYATKVLFLLLFHLILILGVYLPGFLQKGEKSLARFLGMRDFTSLILMSLALTFYSVVILMLSQQTAKSAAEMGLSGFFGGVAWLNFVFAAVYFAGCLIFFASLFFFPGVLVKFFEKGGKSAYVFCALHSAFVFLLGFGYSETVPLGSGNFFEHLRMAGLFWVFILSSLILIGKSLRESSLSALETLELEVAAGKLERQEDILARLKEAFIPSRLSSWIHRLAHQAATKGHDIAQLSHDAINMVSGEKPSELDLRQVEDRYRRADAIYKKLEKENQRFLLSVSFLDINEAERGKIESLKDQFSRELRNGKIELASVRKRIDERLVAIKNAAPAILPPLLDVPVEKVPLTTHRS
jgi:hypothetical protein